MPSKPVSIFHTTAGVKKKKKEAHSVSKMKVVGTDVCVTWKTGTAGVIDHVAALLALGLNVQKD